MGPSSSNTYGNFKCKKESVGEASPTPSNYEMMYSNHCGTWIAKKTSDFFYLQAGSMMVIETQSSTLKIGEIACIPHWYSCSKWHIRQSLGSMNSFN